MTGVIKCLICNKIIPVGGGPFKGTVIGYSQEVANHLVKHSRKSSYQNIPKEEGR